MVNEEQEQYNDEINHWVTPYYIGHNFIGIFWNDLIDTVADEMINFEQLTWALKNFAIVLLWNDLL